MTISGAPIGAAADIQFVGGKVLRAVAGVEADDDVGRPTELGPEVVHEAGGGLAHHEPVHAQRPGAQLGPQAGGPELEAAGEERGQRVPTAPLDEVAKLVAGRGVRVLGEPRADRGAKGVVDHRRPI
jgi:hypothetical protein